MMPQDLVFVVTDGAARIHAPDRQLIRRHCMRNKNKQLGSRRSKRAAGQVAIKASNNREQQDPPRRSDPETRRTRRRVVSCPEEFTEQRSWLVPVKQSIGRPPPSDWALFQFAEDLDLPSRNLMHQYYIRNPIRDMLYPFKYFGIQVNFQEDASWCFRLICSDALYFRAILLLTSAANDLMLKKPLSSATYYYLRRILPILNNRLSATDSYRSDVVIYVVSILASISVLFGDYNAAKTHATGLSEIIRLRSGVDAVNYSPVIQFSIDRLNFSSLLLTKLWKPIYSKSSWSEPIFPTEIEDLFTADAMLNFDNIIEANLEKVALNLQYTSILFNKHYHSGKPADGVLVQECLGFVHSGLIELEGQLKEKLSECLHLAMMVFLATTFRLPGSYEQPYCRNLAVKLQLSYAEIKSRSIQLPQAIDLWLVLMILMSADNQDQLYICLSREAPSIYELSWNEARAHLKQVMWIDCFHDELGKRSLNAFQVWIDSPSHMD